MRGFILGASLVAAVVVLVAAGMNTTLPLPALKDLPLAHAFRQKISVEPGKPLVATMPSSTGFVITLADFGGNMMWKIEINGQVINKDFESWREGVDSHGLPLRNPPLIVPPGGTLKLTVIASSPLTCELGGYFISAEDLGR